MCTNSASDLLKSFASLVFAVFGLFFSSGTVGDKLVDLLCASASIEPVRRDLELMNVVQHCRNLVALRCAKLIFSAGLFHFCGVRLPPTSPLPS